MQQIPVLEGAIHLALFVIAIAAFGIVALALLERAMSRSASDGPARSPTVRRWHVIVALGVLALALGAERLYHVLTGTRG